MHVIDTAVEWRLASGIVYAYLTSMAMRGTTHKKGAVTTCAAGVLEVRLVGVARLVDCLLVGVLLLVGLLVTALLMLLMLLLLISAFVLILSLRGTLVWREL